MDDVQDQSPPNGQPVATPVGPAQKEVGPVGGEAYIEPEPKPELSPELKEVGVEHVSEQIEVPYEAKKAGLEEAKESIPLSAPTATSTVPFTMAQSLNILQIHKNIRDAIVWLAMWCIRQLKIPR